MARSITKCRAYRHQTTLRAGTLFQASKLSLRLWMQAIYLLTSSKTNVAALELKRHLGVNYKTAWRLKHKVMQAMSEREAPRKLAGFVQIDDAYLGGERNGGKRGRGVIWPKRPIASTADSACATCCRGWPQHSCTANLARSQFCAWRAIFMTEKWG